MRDEKENSEEKMAARTLDALGPQEFTRRPTVLPVFFPVMHDGLGEIETTSREENCLPVMFLFLSSR